MKFRILPIAVLAFIAFQAKAQTPNWAENVAPIMYNNCTSCHHAGGIAPFSLMTFDDAFNNKDAMLVNVVQKIMPPWPPDPAYRTFAHQRTLSQTDINTIQTWVMNGAPQGNSSLAPTPPTYTGAATIASPDYTGVMEHYTVNTDYDLYRCFVIPTGVSVDKFITDIEVIPGNRGVVHHVLLFEDVSNTCVNLDAADPDPGYTSFGGVGSSSANLIGAWVPGQTAMHMPANMGLSLPANTNLIMQIHYPGGTYNAVDSTKVLMKFATTTGIRQVSIDPMLHHTNGGNGGLTNGPLYIPANTVKTFNSMYTLPAVNISILNIAPHMHLIGKSIKSWVVTPATDTIPLINIKNWDFHWQGFYDFKKVMKIPASSKVYGEATYDNTTANPHNPNSPPLDVSLGEATADEMMLIYFSYLLYLPGDENIVIEEDNNVSVDEQIAADIVKTPQLYEIFPNPATDNIAIGFYMPKNTSAAIRILDMNGRVVRMLDNNKNFGTGFSILHRSVSDLAPGTYVLSLESDGVIRTKKFIKQ